MFLSPRIKGRGAYGIPDSGAQPLTNEDGSLALAVNGEIYNHRGLRKRLKQVFNFKTNSDCEVIIPVVGDPIRRNDGA